MTEQTINFATQTQIKEIFGSFDENIKQIEKEFDVTIVNRNADVKISGEQKNVKTASNVIKSLSELYTRGENINELNVRYIISLAKDNKENIAQELLCDCICITSKGKPIKAKTLGQIEYVNSIKNNIITVGVGPAGTGKTFLAVALAVAALRRKDVSRIILTRPAVEAGEKLGFLPGDLQNKVDPYLRPLNDALFEMLGAETHQKMIERGTIEIAPLAYMRGRTLDDSFIILDEAQNTTTEQMKMFLTRLGFNSRAIINGDVTQIDLPIGKKSGLIEAVEVLKGIEGISLCNLSSKDVVRHPLVQKVIIAYQKFEDEKGGIKKYE
jgi:phosphate starvation-inducible PhoH-like protein